MMDISLLRANPDSAREIASGQNRNPQIIDDFLAIDKVWLAAGKKLEETKLSGDSADFERLRDEFMKLDNERSRLIGMISEIDFSAMPDNNK